MYSEFQRGDLVWFDPGIGYVLPGEVIEFHKQAQVSLATADVDSFKICKMFP